MSMEHSWNDTDRGKYHRRRETCHSAISSTTNPAQNEVGSNTILRGEMAATNGLNHGTGVSHQMVVCHVAGTLCTYVRQII